MATRLALPTLVLVLVSAASFGTQQERALGPSRVRIYFSVLDKQEKPVPGLSADKFELRLNGKRTDLEGFRPGLAHTDRSIPLVLWILIDWNPNVSAEMMRRQGDAAAKAFTLFNPDSAIGVKLVSDRSETLQPLAHDPAGLHRAFAEFSRRRGMLRVGAGEDSVEVGAGGILGAAEYAIDELVNFSLADPALKGREVHRAIMILSDGNVNPNYGKKPLYEKAGVENVFLYPVFVPRSGPYGLWVEYYFELARKTGGVGSVFGALNPGSKVLPLARGDTRANALTFNFIHLARDLNGKYSFEINAPAQGTRTHLDLRTKVKDVQVRMPRRVLP